MVRYLFASGYDVDWANQVSFDAGKESKHILARVALSVAVASCHRAVVLLWMFLYRVDPA